MLKAIGNIYAYLFGWPAAARMNRRLFQLSSRALGFHNYSSPLLSGEMKVLKDLLRDDSVPVVFDVGANVGDWSAEVLKVNNRAQIHAFEPQPALISAIRANCPQIHINNVAVGEAPGALDLYDYANHAGSQHASLVRGVIDQIHGGTIRTTKVPLVTIDDYCRDNKIEFIKFLKIDVEGFELPVLRGAKRIISERRIHGIQFEFNEMNVLGRNFAQDFMEFFQPGYSVYRILPHGLLELKQGDHWFNEQFVYQNLLAIRR